MENSEQTFTDVVPVAKDTLGGNLRLTFVEQSTGRMVTLEFSSFSKVVDSFVLEQLVGGVGMMRGLGIWPTPPKEGE